MMKKYFNLLILFSLGFFHSCVDELDPNIPIHTGPPPTGVPTSVGTPIGDLITQGLGPEGGTISWENGNYKLVFPEGALTSHTEITIQPITHTLDLGIGTAFDFGPKELDLKRPVELIFQYSDTEISGTSPDLVQIAFQDENNIWQSQREVEVNKTNRTIKAKFSRFNRLSFFATAMIKPGQKTLDLLKSVDLEVVGYEYELSLKTDPKYRDLLSPLVPPSVIQSRLVKEWLVDGKTPLSNQEKGALVTSINNKSKARYTAPTSVPEPETVTVSVELNLGKGKYLLLSQFTIQGSNNFSVGPYSFTNADAIIGKSGGTLSIILSKSSNSGLESVLSFDIPQFSGIGNYPFSIEVKGAVGIIDNVRSFSFSSIAYDDEGPYFNGSIQITESSTQVGGNISGTLSGILYEPVPTNGDFIYLPNAFQASFSTALAF